MKKPDISIIIVSYNTQEITKNCIDSIKKSVRSSPLFIEIVVVDNASKDGSSRMLREKVTQNEQKNVSFRLIVNKKNVGFGRANNQGVFETDAEYILLLNSDTIVLNQSIAKMLEFYKSRKNDIHFLGGGLFNSDHSPQPSCGPFYTLPVLFGALFLRGDYWGLTRYSPKDAQKVDWVSGACLMTKREYFTKLRGFDENIFMYFEEVDLLYRAKKEGYATWFFPEARFIHLGFASSGGARTYPIIKFYEGLMYFYNKHHSPIASFFARFLLQLKAVIVIFFGTVSGRRPLVETYEKASQSI